MTEPIGLCPAETIVGFDGAAGDDVPLVVMCRGDDGEWRVETTDGPDCADIALIAGVFEGVQPPQEVPAPPMSPWAEQVAEWVAAYAGGPFELTDEQRDLLARHVRTAHP